MIAPHFLPATWVIVSEDSPHHPGTIAQVEFYGTEASEGTVVLCVEKTNSSRRLIAVSDQHINRV